MDQARLCDDLKLLTVALRPHGFVMLPEVTSNEDTMGQTAPADRQEEAFSIDITKRRRDKVARWTLI